MVSSLVAEWEARGTRITVDGLEVFVLDAPADRAGVRRPAARSCTASRRARSTGAAVIEPVRAAGRRVVLFDFLGFGLSDKPDVRYSIRGYADTAEAVAKAAGLERGRARHPRPRRLGRRRAARPRPRGHARLRRSRTASSRTASIYMDLVQLTAGQEALLAADDARFDLAALGIDPGDRVQGRCRRDVRRVRTRRRRAETRSGSSPSYQDGHQLLARTIRYIEDRRLEERRFTGGDRGAPVAAAHHLGPARSGGALPDGDAAARAAARSAARHARGHRALPDGRGPGRGSAPRCSPRSTRRAAQRSAPEQERGVVVEEAGRLVGIGAERPVAA